MKLFKNWSLFFAIPVLIATVIGLQRAALFTTPDPPKDQPIHLSANIGDFNTQDLWGKPYSRADLGEFKLTMVNVWATWCPPCVAEMPDLAVIAHERAGTGFQILGIVTDTATLTQKDANAIYKAVQLCEQLGIEYPCLVPDTVLQEGLIHQLVGVPTTWFVDANGNILGKEYIGSRSKAQWDTIINTMLEQVEP